MEDPWLCGRCKNVNAAHRDLCFRCLGHPPTGVRPAPANAAPAASLSSATPATAANSDSSFPPFPPSQPDSPSDHAVLGQRLGEQILRLVCAAHGDQSEAIAAAIDYLESLRGPLRAPPQGLQPSAPVLNVAGATAVVPAAAAVPLPAAQATTPQRAPVGLLRPPVQVPAMAQAPQAPVAAAGAGAQQQQQHHVGPAPGLKPGIAALGAVRAGPPIAGIEGNWECLNCHNVNYPRRTVCNICACERTPEQSRAAEEWLEQLGRRDDGSMPFVYPQFVQQGIKGQQAAANWQCGHCGSINYPHRTSCGRCHAERPHDVGVY
eukprot:m51a1_g463 hypothetical protein (320) ;mRNA; f:173551-174734